MASPAQASMDLLVRVADDPAWAREEAKRVDAYNREHGARYGDEAIPVSLKPNFISADQRALLARAARRVTGALEAFVEAFLDSPELQDAWDVGDQELDLYGVDPGYEGAMQVARFDGLLDGTNLALLEFNCDSPGGAGYGDVIHEAFRGVLDRNPELARGRQLKSPSHVDALRETLLDCYRSWREDRPAPREPTVVLADWPDVGSRPDIDVTVERLRQAGVDARFADPRELVLDGDGLVHQGDPVHLVYKRVITSELLERDGTGDLLEAYRAGGVCMVNAPRSVIVGNKKVMAALRQPSVRAEMTPEQRAAVERFVPWTAVLEDGPVEIDGLRVDLRDLVLDNKDELVLKPARGYGGNGVHLGAATDAATWGALVDDHLDGGDWVVQRAATIPQDLYPMLDDGEVRLAPTNVNVNPFVFGGAYAGAYTRISQQQVINVSGGGGLVPTLTVEDDEPSGADR